MKISENNCQICNKGFKDPNGLNKHISASHCDIDPIEYYMEFVNPSAVRYCRFCGKPAQFNGFTKGFKINCKDPICVNKSMSPFSKEYKMKVDGLSLEEYEKWSIEDRIIKKKNTEEGFKNKRKDDVDFDKKNSRYCKEFWIKKGFDIDEAKKLAYGETNKSRKKMVEILENDPNYMKGKSWASKDYWIKKGYSEEESISIVSKKQATFSLEKCIEKYGKDAGTKRWKDRQEKWLKNLDSKSDEEKLEILKKKILGNKKFSKISQELFFSILSSKLFDENKCFFANNKGEKDITIGTCVFKPDFIYENKIIEFFGDYWHCNPETYLDEEKKIRRGSRKYTVRTIRKIDKFRLDSLRNFGYNIMVVWEKDYINNKKEIINKCIKFLNND